MGLASAAAHAHYVNGMVSARGEGHHHPAAALHAAVAAAAAASAAARTQRTEIEHEDVDRGIIRFVGKLKFSNYFNLLMKRYFVGRR